MFVPLEQLFGNPGWPLRAKASDGVGSPPVEVASSISSFTSPLNHSAAMY